MNQPVLKEMVVVISYEIRVSFGDLTGGGGEESDRFVL